jgi:hypothetical protein
MFMKRFYRFLCHKNAGVNVRSIFKKIISKIPITGPESWDVTTYSNSFWPGILPESQDFLESSSPEPGKTPLRQKYFWPEEFNQCDLPGFPTGGKEDS